MLKISFISRLLTKINRNTSFQLQWGQFQVSATKSADAEHHLRLENGNKEIFSRKAKAFEKESTETQERRIHHARTELSCI